LGAQACFFETQWSRVSSAFTEGDQAWLLNDAAMILHALGRLTDALEPMRAGLPLELRRGDWKNAAIRAGNLSALELELGDVAGALGDAEQSVIYADRSGDTLRRVDGRAIHASALLCAGRQAEAGARFREAEQMRADPEPPLLYSLHGFRYCDLLLTGAEREAGKADGEGEQEELLAACRAVTERAAQTLKGMTGLKSPLPIALDHLTLGRAALYATILQFRSRRRGSAQASSSPPTPEQRQRGLMLAATELDQAVSGFRDAGLQGYVPLGLLTRAWLRSVTGLRTGPESAQSDLDEAREIAERRPMPLFLADIHLYRARLFFRDKPYPWESPRHDLAEARRLIFKHGYLRRKEELEDAESAITQDVSSR